MKKNSGIVLVLMMILISVMGWFLLPKSVWQKILFHRVVRGLPVQDYKWEPCTQEGNCGIVVAAKVIKSDSDNTNLAVKIGERVWSVVLVKTDGESGLFGYSGNCVDEAKVCEWPVERLGWGDIKWGNKAEFTVERVYGNTLEVSRVVLW